jgi:DNA-binding CsgD family transcriptional regulator
MRDYYLQRWLLSITFLCLWFQTIGQEVNMGRLPIKNYLKSDIKVGTQTWDIAQDKNKVLYFANNDGLLRFDGTHWDKYPVPNNTIVRSVELTDDGRIYVGAQGELGYFYPNESGHLVYQSLLENLDKAYHNFADVWKIEKLNGDLYFQSSRYIFQWLSSGQFKVFATNDAFLFLGKANEQIYVQEDIRGLMKMDSQSGGLTPLAQCPFIITALLSLSEKDLLVVSLKQGIFQFDEAGKLKIWKTNYDGFFAEKRIYCASMLSEQQIALGTSLGGLVIMDKYGNAIRHLDQITGLQNSNLLSLYTDAANNLWCGLDNGIDYVEVQSAFTQVNPDFPLDGTGYNVAVHNDLLYLATSTGLFVTDLKQRYSPVNQRNFQLVAGTTGQNWSLSKVDGDLLLGHHEGTFQLQGDRAVKVGSDGCWRTVPFGENGAIAGHYKGLAFLKKGKELWNEESRLKGFDESCRILAPQKEGNIWMTHPYRGVYLLRPIPERDSVAVRLYTTMNGLPSDLNNYVFEVNGQALFATKSGVYIFDESRDAFYPDTLFNNVLGKDSWVKFLKNDEQGNIWFVTAEEAGYLEILEKGLTQKISKRSIPELSNKQVGGFECIYPVDKENIFFGSEKGFILFNPVKYTQSNKPKTPVLLHRVEVLSHKDTIVAGSYFVQIQQHSKKELVFDARVKNLRFTVSAPWYDGDAPVQYRYWLENLDEEWTEWNVKAEKEYTNLEYGQYRLHVQARKYGELLGEKLVFDFRINTPWYATVVAKVFYVIVLLSLFGGLLFVQRKKHDAFTAELKSGYEETVEQQQAQVQKTEAKLVQLRNEALESELQFRQKELAANAMHLMQKGELLQSIKEELQKALRKENDPEQLKTEVKKIIIMLEQDNILDESWEQFLMHFNQVHAGFFDKLRQQFPNLTSYDQKMTAYLRMNLTTKEIATLLNISVRGVEGGRYRLRKKMGLDSDTNLVNFIQEI